MGRSGTVATMVPAPREPRIVGRGQLIAVASLVAVAIALVTSLAESGTATETFNAGLDLLPWALFAVLCSPVLVFIALRPQRGILLLVALVPFNGLLLLLPERPPFVDGWKEALAVYSLLWAGLNFVGSKRVKRDRPKFVGPLVLYVGVGIASAVVVATNASPIQAAVGLKVGYFWLALALAAWLAPLTVKDRDRLVSLLMGAGLVTALWGIAQQFMGHESLVKLGYQYDENIRFTGGFMRSISSFPSPFNFAFFLTLVILVGLPIALEDQRRRRSQIFLWTLPIQCAALALTFVRGAWLALAVGLFVLAIRRYGALFLPVPVALIGLAAMPGSFSATVLQSDSLDDRTVGWGQNLTRLLEAPFGRGIGTTGAAAEKYVELNGAAGFGALYQPDNQYFKALYEIGGPGFFFYLMLLIAIVVALFGIEKRLAGVDLGFALGLSATVYGAMAASLVATWLEIFPNEFYLWSLVVVAHTAVYPESS